MDNTHYSVLMSVYKKESAENLRQAMESIENQTVKPDDFVLMCDGPLTSELDEVIQEKVLKLGSVLNVIRLKENVGLGAALNTGIRKCKHELVARMDSDDISLPDRCERQLDIFKKYPEVSVCSGTIEEFVGNVHNITGKRIVPEKNKDIVQFAKKRCPYNHPCVMYKKSAVIDSGSYRQELLEDYYLWIRMILHGYQGYNIQETLLYMRAPSDMYKRRSGWKYAKQQVALLKFMKDSGFTSSLQYYKNVIIRTGSALAPNWIREMMFKTFLRK